MRNFPRLSGAAPACLLQVDRLGSVIGLLQAGRYQRRTFGVYGHSLFTVTPVLGFNGELLDSYTQGYLLGQGYRMYSPALRRFVSSDAYSPFGVGGGNAYAYCEGDPVNREDPSGRGFLQLIRNLFRFRAARRTEPTVVMFRRNSAFDAPSRPVVSFKAEALKESQLITQLRERNRELAKSEHYYRVLHEEKDGMWSALVRVKDGDNSETGQMLERDRGRARFNALKRIRDTQVEPKRNEF